MPNLALKEGYATGRKPNIFDRLVSNWDRKTLKKAMAKTEESKPQTVPLSFRFIDQIKHYDCQVFRSRHHYFIGGCQVEHKVISLTCWTKKAI
ncbi:MAG: hypothetical protein MI862_26530 [Desulfobacterales bacterium]|nr:hypothetical protein [Desulfobacterales bacterium]